MPTLFDLRQEKEKALRRDVSKAEIARAIRVNKVRYGYFESGEAEPKLSEMFKLAEYFEKSIEEIASAIQETRRERERNKEEDQEGAKA